MKKILIQTQYQENYGTPNDPYWKFKGGEDYLVYANDGEETVDVVNFLKPFLSVSTEMQKEYILGFEDITVDNPVANHINEWDTITEVYPGDSSAYATAGEVKCLRNINNREDGWMRKEILEKTEAWTMLHGQERKKYSATFLMNDGDILTEKELIKFFQQKEVA